MKTYNTAPRFEEAARLVLRLGRATLNELQRNLGVGYLFATQLMSELEAAGIIGSDTGKWQRDLLIHSTEELEVILTRIGTNEYLLPATLETLADVIFQRLSVLATFAAELDAPMAYEYNPEDID